MRRIERYKEKVNDIEVAIRRKMSRTVGAHSLLVKAFSKIWSKRLHDDFTGKQCKVIQVRGWRTCLLDTPSGCRQTVTFMFKFEKLEGL